MNKTCLIEIFKTAYSNAQECLIQKSFYFDTSPEVHFINNNEEICEYNDLPEVSLTIEEQKLLRKQPDPKLNEPQILIKSVKYDDNKIYIEAYRCDYKLLAAYGNRKFFPLDSPIYDQKFFKIGSIAVLITTDDKTIIVERNDVVKTFSSFGGFLKPVKFKNENIAITTAIEEIQEEFIQYTNFEINNPNINALSFRKNDISCDFITEEFVEFIVTIRINSTAEELVKALRNNLTKSIKPNGIPDHTGRYKLIDLKNISEKDFEIQESNDSIKKIRSESFYYVDPIIAAACKFLQIDIPKFMQKENLNDMSNCHLL